VQRAVIILRAKNVEFQVTYINLREKPDWFLEISPHGKVPVLVVDDQPLFESNAIGEYLDEMAPPRLHPEDPVKRARNRAWTDFVPDFARAFRESYYGKTKEEVEEKFKAVPGRVIKLEQAIAKERDNDGPYFNGPDLCQVDAAYAPFLQRFAIIEAKRQTGLLKDFPLVQAWSDALLSNAVITGSVPDNFDEEFAANLARKGCYLSAQFEAEAPAAE